VGEIKGLWLSEEQKLEILIMIEQAKEKGFPVTKTCAFWRVNRRRVVRWCRKKKTGQSLRNLKPGPREPVHKLLPDEREAVLQMAKKEEYADLAHRILAARRSPALISDGVGTSVICQLMRKESFSTCFFFLMSILVRPSPGQSVGIKPLKNLDVFWKKV